MNKLPILGCCFLFASGAVFAAPAAPPAPVGESAKVNWTLTADHADAIYKVGETVTFTVKFKDGVTPASGAELFWRLSKDGVEPISTGKVSMAKGTATFSGTLDEPGFLQCRVSEKADGKGVVTQWGVAFSPDQIKRSLPIPQDFDTFWKGRLDALAAIPINPNLTPVKVGEGKSYEAFDLKLDSVGGPVTGYFAKPSDAKPKSLPAILTLHGAGVRGSNLAGPATWASSGFLAIDINAHGIVNGKDEAFYQALAAGELKDYRFKNRGSREENYFTGMFLRAKRALDFLASQPEWDGKTLVVSGGSQGGFQAFAAAALDDRVTMMVAQVPAGCDHSGMLANRVSGWPKFVPIVDGKPDAAVLEASRYIDNVNFAARCKAETAIVSAGFVDGACPPTSVYAAYNELPLKDKKILNMPGSGHSVAQKFSDIARQAVIAHAKR